MSSEIARNGTGNDVKFHDIRMFLETYAQPENAHFKTINKLTPVHNHSGLQDPIETSK